MNNSKLNSKAKIQATYGELEALMFSLENEYRERFFDSREKLSETELYRWDHVLDFYNKTLARRLGNGQTGALIGFSMPLKQMLAILHTVSTADTADIDLLNLVGKIHQKAINTHIVDMENLIPKRKSSL